MRAAKSTTEAVAHQGNCMYTLEDARQSECVGPGNSGCALTCAHQREQHLMLLLPAVLDVLPGSLIDLLELALLLRICGAKPAPLIRIPFVVRAAISLSSCLRGSINRVSMLHHQHTSSRLLMKCCLQQDWPQQPSSRHCRALCSASDRSVKNTSWP